MSDYDVDVHVSVPNAVFKTLRQVADEEKTTVAAVVREVLRTYVPPAPSKRPPAAGSVDEQVQQMNEQGMTDREIAVALGLTYTTVSRRRKNLGLPTLGWARRVEAQRGGAS